MSIRLRSIALAVLLPIAAHPLVAQQPAGAPPGAAPATGAPQGTPTPPRRPRPYGQVITNRAKTDRGGITVHQVEDRWFFEVPDSLLRRDFLFVSRIAGVPTNFPGFTPAGTSLEERMIRWERQGDRLLMRGVATVAYSDDSLPIAISVASNNIGPILASFPVAAYTSDSSSVVVDVTDFFAGDTPGISGLTPAQRRQYQVRRLDPARSFVNTAHAYPLNIEVRHTQTYDAGEPPSDATSGTITLEMRQSIVLLPREPMRPRYADDRVGFFGVSRINYGLDEQKAATQRFIRRWRLEPKDPAAYARGELVEPIKPIVYYIDPATPTKWRPYVREGVNAWAKVFEAAGFKNAIMAKDAPTAKEDPSWDPEDIRYSVVRWAASLVRNAQGPSTSDPRTGEIIESDITWYHNHMRSYRNRLITETGASNPDARTLDIPESLMGETMRQVITHEVGHALGLPHNMAASYSYPVDSLRSKSFTSVYGVSATIMDYARQNYVAQPGDGLAPKDFIRRLGPFDRFVINWGYRVIPEARTPEAERPILNRWVTEQKGPLAYRYIGEGLTGIDPRSQTEDIGDDPIRASTYAIANMKRMVPNLIQWTSRPGEDYDDLSELYGEALQNWARYMNHVVALVGGVSVNAKTSDQAGVVYDRVPRARQQAALKFVADEVFLTPTWLAPDPILSRIGPQPANGSLSGMQANVLNQLTDVRRLSRLADAEAADAANAYTASAYMADLRSALWGGTAGGVSPDANRRALQRLYLQRLAALIAPPTPPAAGAQAQQQQNPNAPPIPGLLLPPDVPRSDLPALVRSELRSIRVSASAASRSAPSSIARAHFADVVDRIDVALEAGKK
ncbi:MAG: hypothetical protein JWL61_5462 [Gemmatimonadetes bacterium]|nr:hypothetical protein [Gemmatimonadota bacterium]